MTENIQGKKKILVCPMNWGLGHAVRDVPIIQRLVDLGHEVILAGKGAPLDLLRAEFPELETQRLGSLLRVRYSLRLPAWLKITFLSPLILYEIFFEHYRLRRIIRRVRPDLIISDNRYGLWHRRVPSILITHQLSIRLPAFASFLEIPVNVMIRTFIEQFDRCWIPDFPGENNLSGDLSHRYPPPRNSVFIGAISRFTSGSSPGTSQIIPKPGHSTSKPGHSTVKPGQSTPKSGHYSGEPPGSSTAKPLDLLILLSGPEPQRSVLENIILKQVFSLDARCVILQGLPGKAKRTDLTSTVSMYSHLPAAELRQLLYFAENVICRAGYTGIMDLALMRKKTLIIPTPGQTEQEYLAEYLARKGMFLTCSQDQLSIPSALKDMGDFNPLFNLPDKDFLQSELDRI
ncbi:glycosyltransferase [Bacteroidota bacterium]